MRSTFYSTILAAEVIGRYGVVCLLCAALAVLSSGCGGGVDHWSIDGTSMGTRYHITVVPSAPGDPGPVPRAERTRLAAHIAELLAEMDRELSTYLPDSALSQFNRAPTGVWLSVPARVYELATLSMELYEQTQGAFDAGVGALVELWGFGAASMNRADDGRRQRPSDERIRETRALSSIRWLMADTDSTMLHKSRALHLDFSAIAKGYAVDEIASMLHDRGYRNYLVEFGGEIKAGGLNPDAEPWRIGVVAPRPDALTLGDRVYGALLLRGGQALATSGEYRNYEIVNGERRSHTIDPATGNPVAHEWASVTVLHSSAARADALATALNVMGHEQGVSFSNEMQLAALFVVYDARTLSYEHYGSDYFPGITR